MITNSELHYQIIKGIIENGFAPTVADILQSDIEKVEKKLYDLQDYRLSPRGEKYKDASVFYKSKK